VNPSASASPIQSSQSFWTCAFSSESAIIEDGLMPAPTTLPAQLSIAFAA
jgi:hypothetical protein